MLPLNSSIVSHWASKRGHEDRFRTVRSQDLAIFLRSNASVELSHGSAYKSDLIVSAGGANV